jgi:thiamine-phosphate pyrophosphorylase
LSQGRRLSRIARRRGLVFLVGADPALASRLFADGMHLPERLAGRSPGLRHARPRWIMTCAAHSAPALAAARRARVDAVFLSPVFPSGSPSAGRPLGLLRFAMLARRAGLPVFALGGVNGRTVRGLAAAGASGFAAVEALRTAPRT